MTLEGIGLVVILGNAIFIWGAFSIGMEHSALVCNCGLCVYILAWLSLVYIFLLLLSQSAVLGS